MTKERFFQIIEAEGMHIDDDLDKESFWNTRPKWIDENQEAETRLKEMVRELIDTAFVYNVSRSGVIARPKSISNAN